ILVLAHVLVGEPDPTSPGHAVARLRLRPTRRVSAWRCLSGLAGLRRSLFIVPHIAAGSARWRRDNSTVNKAVGWPAASLPPGDIALHGTHRPNPASNQKGQSPKR